MEIKEKVSIFWFRRDLRLEDNAGLYYALRSNNNVLPIFIFDENILEKLDDKYDKRVDFIHQALQQLQESLSKLQCSVLVKIGKPVEVWKQLAETYDISEVFTNHDYEKYAILRDNSVRDFLNSRGIAFYTYKDQAIFEKNEVLSGTKSPYTVFTPYSKKWKETLSSFYLKSYPTEKYFGNFLKTQTFDLPSLEEIGFKKTNIVVPKKEIGNSIIAQYKDKRDYPAIVGTSRLSVHLRFGTISIRQLARKAVEISTENNGAEGFLNELIWRDFYFNITHHFPHITDGKAFRQEYDRVIWRNNEDEFHKWCVGKTGYPIVDAGMRELNTTGFMHNRVRMITASFLIKHLLIDWRWGETYFAKKLLDFDFSANNGGWQWAASSGCDAAPYFRIFNPSSQTEKFDKDLKYIKSWIPELNTFDYPRPIVEHSFARERVLKAYKLALEK